MVAAVSILTTFLVLRGLAAVFAVSFVVQFLVGLIGLGVAIDYSLLFVVRWREERDHGADPPMRSGARCATAGHSIVVSGTTVAIGLLALVGGAGAVHPFDRRRRVAHPARQRARDPHHPARRCSRRPAPPG